MVALLFSVLQVGLFVVWGSRILFLACFVLYCLALLYGDSCSEFFVNDLSLKFVIPTFLLFADDRKIWLDVKSAQDCKYLQWHIDTVRK